MPGVVRAHKESSKTLAFISDIHGQVDALEAVLEAIQGHPDIGGIYALGDHFLDGPDPMAIWTRLQSAQVECLQGLSEQALTSVNVQELDVEGEQQAARLAHFVSTRKALGELVLERVRRLPVLKRLPLINGSEVVLMHGSPADVTQEISHDMSDEEINALLADDPADVIMCGASHVAFQRFLGEVLVVNVGSVGAAPGGDAAHYTLLRPLMDRNEVEQLSVPLAPAEQP